MALDTVWNEEWCRNIFLRPEGSDLGTYHDVIRDRDYRPPYEMPNPQVILDLGSNIGVTVLALAMEHPDADVRGFELDHENVQLARRNTYGLGDRVYIAWEGIAAASGDRAYQHNPCGQNAHRLSTDGDWTAHCMDMSEAMYEYDIVDYVKMDIEGAEYEVLFDPGDWARRVKTIKVEIHPPWAVEEILTLMTEWWHVRPDDRHHSCLIGVR